MWPALIWLSYSFSLRSLCDQVPPHAVASWPGSGEPSEYRVNKAEFVTGLDAFHV